MPQNIEIVVTAQATSVDGAQRLIAAMTRYANKKGFVVTAVSQEAEKNKQSGVGAVAV